MASRTYIISQPHPYLDYTLDGLSQDSEYVVLHHRRKKSLKATITRFIRHLLPGRHRGLWTRSILPDDYLEVLKEIGPEDKVIFWSIGNLKDIRIIKEETDAASYTAMILDPLRQICHFSERELKSYPERMSSLGVKVCTFDKQDAERHGLTYVGQVYRYPDMERPDATAIEERDNDGKILFIGIDKRRAEKLNSLITILENERVPYDFRILYDHHSERGRYPLLDRCELKEPLPYQEVLRLSERSHCLVDILQPGQTGLTMRALEALFFGKKLITDNIGIRDERFYHPDNIFIIDNSNSRSEERGVHPASEKSEGRVEQRTLRQFLDTPLSPIDAEIIKQYDIRSWIKRL